MHSAGWAKDPEIQSCHVGDGQLLSSLVLTTVWRGTGRDTASFGTAYNNQAGIYCPASWDLFLEIEISLPLAFNDCKEENKVVIPLLSARLATTRLAFYCPANWD